MLTRATFLFRVPLTFSVDLPAPLRIGDGISFNFHHQKVEKGRTYQIHVQGDYLVVTCGYVHETPGGNIQVVTLKPREKEPTWKAVKTSKRVLPPASCPRQRIF